LEVFGSWLGPVSYYFRGWKGWKLENGGWKVENGSWKFEDRGGAVVADSGFGLYVGDIQGGDQLLGTCCKETGIS
jgi:hypothetical protein